ncbi:low molecular weight phosphatase family protein [Prosthecomicrobium hirschii]|nr:low molecular weight phosphatase family protein [Prosthecomicrobium hirschii]
MVERTRPSAVLFACSMNAVRSPMAEAIAKHLFNRKIYFQSAGVRPGGELDPFAVKVLEEIGLDISRHRPRTFDDIEDSNFDLIVTLAPEAHHKALDLTRTQAMDVEYWPTQDPQLASGSREQILEAYRTVRDGLMRRIKDRLGWSPQAHD